MQRITSRPELLGSRTDPAVVGHPTTRALSQADLVLIVAVVVPVAIMGLLILIGVGVGAAVCITFVLVFAVTTTMDVRWFLRRGRLRNDLSRSQS